MSLTRDSDKCTTLRFNKIIEYPNIYLVSPKDTYCPKCGDTLDCVGYEYVLVYWCSECLSLCPQCGTYPVLELNNNILECANCEYKFC